MLKKSVLEHGNFCLVSARLSLKRYPLLRTIFRAVSEQFSDPSRQWRDVYPCAMILYNIYYYYFLILYILLQIKWLCWKKVCWSTVIFVSLVRVWASRDTPLLRTIFRAVSEQYSEPSRQWRDVYPCYVIFFVFF